MFKVNVKEEIEKKNDLITRAEALVNGAEMEKRELTDDEKEELAEIRDNVRDIKAKLDTITELDDLREVVKEDGGEMKDEAIKENACTEEAEKRAFEAYIRGITLNERAGDPVPMEKGDNGAVIPTTIANKIIAKVYDICPILERSTKYNVKGKLIIPKYVESAEGAITVAYAEEFVDLESNVGSFDKVELEEFLAGALTLISKSLINNAQFNLTDFIVERMAYAIKRFVEGELLNGTEDKVEGLTGVTLGVTAEATTAVTADEIIDLHDSIKDDFQDGAIWIMSPATRTALRKLTTTTGEYLLNDDISTPFGSSILGKPVYVSDNMPDMAAGKVAIYYGDMKGLATKFSEDMEIEVIREKYLTMHAVGVVGWIEFDGAVENEQMIAKLTMAAS